MNKQKLIKLRQENCGYNPENAEDLGEVDQVDNFTLFITYENHTMVFYKTKCKNELEYLEKFSGIYGVVYNKEFYTLGE